MSCDTLTFYHQVWCPKSQSVHLALEASQTPHATVEVGTNNTEHRCNETSDSPILVQNGQTALRNYKEAAAYLKLLSNDPTLRSKQERILNDFAEYIVPYFEKAVMLESPREGMDLFIEALSFLENELIYAGGLYFGGDQPNVVDYGLFPYIDKIGKWTDELEAKDCPRVQAWVKAMRDFPLVAKVLQNKCDQEHLQNYSASLSNSH